MYRRNLLISSRTGISAGTFSRFLKGQSSIIDGSGVFRILPCMLFGKAEDLPDLKETGHRSVQDHLATRRLVWRAFQGNRVALLQHWERSGGNSCSRMGRTTQGRITMAFVSSLFHFARSATPATDHTEKKCTFLDSGMGAFG